MDSNYDKAVEILKKYNQQHIIPFIYKSNFETREKLINQILRIDFEELKFLYEKTFESLYVDLEELNPVTGINPCKLKKQELEKYIEIGTNIIKSGKFAVATMAGGQGTRLGRLSAKGMYKIDFKDGEKSLFEIIVDTLKRANDKYGVIIPWYLMTSDENNEDTVKFLEENEYFGYPKEHIYIFKQGKLPLLTESGKLLIGSDGLIKEGSNGNGGIFNSMRKRGVIADMNKRGIEWVFIGSVDNILLKYVDVLLLGLTVSKRKSNRNKNYIKKKSG